MSKNHINSLKHLQLKPIATLLGLAVSLPLSSSVQAAWLNAYGTPDKETGSGFYEDPNGDGYYLIGNAMDPSNPSSQTPTAELIAKLNAKGDVLWSKKIIDQVGVAPYDLDGSGNFNFYTLTDKTGEGTTKFTWGKAKIDPTTHAISVVFAKAFKSQAKGFFTYNPETSIATGYAAAASSGTIPAYDAAVAMLDSNGNVTWSHVYDYKSNDSFPQVQKLDSGYLISWTYLDFNTTTFTQDQGTVITKLDTSGNISGPSVDLSESGSVRKLASGGFLVSGTTIPQGSIDPKPFIVKLDSNFNVVWGKRIDGGSATDSYYVSFSRELSDGTLELSGLHSFKEASLTKKGDLTVRVSKDGALLSAKEIQFTGLEDFNIFDFDSNGKLLGWGNKTETNGKTGIIAQFNENLESQWMRTLTGIEVDGIYANPKQSGYLLPGSTLAHGAGQSDLIAGTFDTNGNIEGCSVIGAANGAATAITPPITLSDLGATTSPVSLVDKGSVNATIEDVPFTINTADVNLTKTQICNDGKDIGTGGGNNNGGGGNNTGGNGGGTTTGKPVVSQTESADPVQVNQPFSYTVSFTNNAAFEATNVKLTNKLPSKAKRVSDPVPSQGLCNKGKATVVCKFGTVASGASVNVTFTVTKSKAGKVRNSAVFTYKMVKKAGSKRKFGYQKASVEKTTVTK